MMGGLFYARVWSALGRYLVADMTVGWIFADQGSAIGHVDMIGMPGVREYCPVPGCDDLSISHSRLRAPQAGIGPLHSVQNNQFEFFSRYRQKMAQCFPRQ